MIRSQDPALEDAPRPGNDIYSRRNVAERAVRARLADLSDVYVERSSWRRVDADLQPFVAVIARHDEGRLAAQRALASISGLTDEQWRTAWLPLDLGDFMIRVFPGRTILD